MSLTAIFSDLAAGGVADERPGDGNGDIDVATMVSRWMTAGPQVFAPGPDRAALDALCRQIDVRKRISARYRADWRRAEPEAAARDTTVAAVIAALLANCEQLGQGHNNGWGLKCLNSALKAIDLWPGTPHVTALRVVAAGLLDRIADLTPADPGAAVAATTGPPATPRTIPLTVLAWEGPQARAYLVRMRRAGIRPERILLMVRHPAAFKAGGAAGGRRPLMLGRAERAQDRAHNFHPYALRSRRPDLVAAIVRAMAPLFADPAAAFEEMYDGFSYDAYADRVVRVSADSYRDPRLVTALREHGVTTALFTGGGIVPAPVFDLPGIRLLHVHTGLLPHVRGADVLLWSLLTRGRPGVSAFVMTAGLDDGDVLAATELPPTVVTLPSGARPDDDTLYRALFSFIDPLVRAELLVAEVLEPACDLGALTGGPQDLQAGLTFHFMHPTIRARALRMLFANPPTAFSATGSAATATSKEDPSARAARRGSPASYAKFYEKPSARAPMRFALDAGRADSNLRALSIRNRQADYPRLADDVALLALHRELNHQLVLQDAHWPSYDYGEGYFYQSSAPLGITGLRDTSARIAAFGLADLVRDRTVLEIGCNTGFLTLEVARAARRIVAFELNPYLVAVARAAAAFQQIGNVEWLVSAFEDFNTDERFDDVLSFANHHTYDGNTRQDLHEYFARCHALVRPGGRLIFESHPPELEGDGFPGTLALLEGFFEIERIEVPDYGTFLDRGRRFLVARRRANPTDPAAGG